MSYASFTTSPGISISFLSHQEPLPEPSAAEIAREAEQEAMIFSQAANVDKLLTMLRSYDPATDNLADDEEIQVKIDFTMLNTSC